MCLMFVSFGVAYCVGICVYLSGVGYIVECCLFLESGCCLLCCHVV